MVQVYSISVSFDDDSFAFVTLIGQICSGVSFVGADNTLKSEKNRQESDKRNSSVNHLATSVFSRDVSLCSLELEVMSLWNNTFYFLATLWMSSP